MNKPHSFHYCRAVEIPHPVVIPDHDDFAEGLELNYEEIEPNDVAKYAKALARTALRDVSLPENVINIDEYRYGRIPAA